MKLENVKVPQMKDIKAKKNQYLIAFGFNTTVEETFGISSVFNHVMCYKDMIIKVLIDSLEIISLCKAVPAFDLS